MKPAGDTSVPTDPAALDVSTVNSILRDSLSERPVTDLVARLAEPDGDEWFAAVVSTIASQDRGPTLATLLQASPTLDELRSLKRKAKSLFDDSATVHERRLGTLIYLLTVGAGLVHHGRLLSSQRRSEIDDALVELQAVVPSPWVDLIDRAIATRD